MFIHYLIRQTNINAFYLYCCTYYQKYMVVEGFSTLLLESYRPADFSSDPAPTVWLGLDLKSVNLWDGISPGAGLETPGVV